MSARSTIADYPDAVGRVVEANVDDSATTRDEVLAELRRAAASVPQIDGETARAIADAVITDDRVIDEIEASGELPTEAEIDAVAGALDDYELDERVDSVADSVRGSVATVEDVDQAIDERRDPSRPLFRENVEAAVDSIAERKRFAGESPDRVVRDQAIEEGAPRERDFERVTAQAVATADQVEPADVVEGTSSRTPVSIVRDNNGFPVAAIGGAREELGREVADQYDVPWYSTEQATDAMDVAKLARSDRSVAVTLSGRYIGEVNVS